MKTILLAMGWAITLALATQAATQIDIPGPPGSSAFGTSVTVLPNGNFVVTDPNYDLPSPPTSDVGAVYIYKPDGTLISRLRGSAVNDRAGNGGAVVLANGHFVVISTNWSGTAGAATWGHAETGFTGGVETQISSANSLVGSSTSDFSGAVIYPLANGNYLLMMPFWNNTSPAANEAGAVAWGNGFSGSAGVIGASNAVVGTSPSDQVGFGGGPPRLLPNGHYVIHSPNWDNGPTADVGATTWCNGFTGTAGEVSTSNSLIGGQANDGSSASITVLPNGSYTVNRPFWDLPSPATQNVGAVTWCRGDSPTVGLVSTANSAHGSSTSDEVSSVFPMADGRYAIIARKWDDSVSGIPDAGIITLADAITGLTGPLDASLSLVGSSTGDFNTAAITPLTNGNHVIALNQWDNPSGPLVNVGLVLFVKAGAPLVGTTTASMGLTGDTASDSVGTVTALSNGNYLVRSNSWDNVAALAVNAGAVTWCNGRTGRKGRISASNSLVGTTTGDSVGASVIALSTHSTANYVVRTLSWDDPLTGVPNVGAVTWVDGSRGITGKISASNSLVGTTSDDGNLMSVVALENGNYVVAMPEWDDVENGLVAGGAVIWCDGKRGKRGKVVKGDALVGTTNFDAVGSQVLALRGGNYLVASMIWNHAAVGLSAVGALTWGNGLSGIRGKVSPANSIVGTSALDNLGVPSSFSYTLDHLEKTIVYSRFWDNPSGPLIDAGAFVLIDNDTGGSGLVSTDNSVLGMTASAPFNGVRAYDPIHNQMIVGRPASNLVTRFIPGAVRSIARGGAAAPGSTDITYAKPGFVTVNSVGEVLADWTLAGSGTSAGKNRALFDSDELVLQTGTTLSLLGEGLPSNAKATGLFGQVFQQPWKGLFQATVSGTGINSSNNRLLLLENGAAVMILKRTGQAWGVAPQTTAQFSTFSEVLQSHDQDLIALSYKLKSNAAIPVDSGNDTGILLMNHFGTITNSLPREGEASFGGGGTFGQFSGRATASQGEFIHFIAAHDPSGNSPPVPAIFRMKKDGTSTSRPAQVGGPFTAISGATWRSFTGISQIGGQAVVLATLAGVPAATNQVLYALPGNVVLARKGDQVDAVNNPELVISKIIRFWGAASGQIIIHVELSGGTNRSNNQALILKQTVEPYLILARTGSILPGGVLKSINAVEVHPVTGSYAILGTLAGVPSSANQALWIGNCQTGNETTLSTLRLPALRLRKGQVCRSSGGSGNLVRGISMKPAADASGAGGRGLAQIMNPNGDVAVTITIDRNVQEMLLIER